VPATPVVRSANVGEIDYRKGLNFQIVQPGTLSPTSVNSVTVEVFGQHGGMLQAYDQKGRLLGSVSILGPTDSRGGVQVTIAEPGIYSFVVTEPLLPGPFGLPLAYGVGEVSVSFVQTPEPASFVLGLLGLLGLAASARRRPSPAI
jgi:MYXO-CTERM domain-containing protein